MTPARTGAGRNRRRTGECRLTRPNGLGLNGAFTYADQMSDILSRRFTPSPALVAQYVDRGSGHRILVSRPDDQPDLWLAYLAGARTSYRRHDVESVLEYDDVVDGRSTALFFAAVDRSRRVVAGMRVQGPYLHPDESHAVTEWAGRPGTEQLRNEIGRRIPDGVIEMKTGWVDDDAENRRPLAGAMARVFVHSLRLMNVRYAMGTVGQHAIRRWRTCGGVVSDLVTPVAYPDDRHSTVLMWWDRQTFADLANDEQLPLILDESAQLEGRGLPLQRNRAISA